MDRLRIYSAPLEILPTLNPLLADWQLRRCPSDDGAVGRRVRDASEAEPVLRDVLVNGAV